MENSVVLWGGDRGNIKMVLDWSRYFERFESHITEDCEICFVHQKADVCLKPDDFLSVEGRLTAHSCVILFSNIHDKGVGGACLTLSKE